jgi:hypothetical protein
MSVHAYPPGTAVADGARALTGAGLAAVALAVPGATAATLLIAAPIAVLFAAWGIIILGRHLSTVQIDHHGITVLKLWPRTIAWHDLEGYRLRYYSTRRDRSRGWLELTVSSCRLRISIDSRIAGFETVLHAVVRAARAHGVGADAATLANLQACGFSGSAGDRSGVR